MANVDSVDITVYGLGGHGARPHTTKDPVVLASQIVLALQTIVSRETKPGEAAVVTVGSIHGGTKHNIIPDEVRLQVTVRSFSEEVRQQILEGIKRVARGQAISAGLPEKRMPVVKVGSDFTRSTYNDPELTERLVTVFKRWFGEAKLRLKPPSTGGEDFGEFSLERKIPLCMFSVGGVDPARFEQAGAAGDLPSLHSPFWAPVPEPTIQTGVTAMAAAVLELLSRR
jgi:hippurate hydrolase